MCEVLLVKQSAAGSEDLIDTRLVGLKLLFKVLMLLHFAVEVGRVQVIVVRRELQFLVYPPCIKSQISTVYELIIQSFPEFVC